MSGKETYEYNAIRAGSMDKVAGSTLNSCDGSNSTATDSYGKLMRDLNTVRVSMFQDLCSTMLPHSMYDVIL